MRLLLSGLEFLYRNSGAVFANLRIDTAGIVKSYDPAASANCAIAIVDPGFNGLLKTVKVSS
jgi:hypothetical protein